MRDRRLVVLVMIAIIVIASLGWYSYVSFTTPTAPSTSPTPSPETTPQTSAPQRITLYWGTASAGTTSYMVLGLVAELISRYLPEYEIIVMPTASSTASTKAYASGELNGCYAGSIILKEIYAGIGRFKDFTPKRLPVHTFWAYEHEVTIAIHQRDLGRFKCWKDLNGTKAFLGKSDWDMHIALRAALEALGIKVEHIELETGMVADALQRGIIVATMIPTTSGITTSPWVKELELSVPLAILNPCPDEIELLRVKSKELGVFGVAVNYAAPERIFVTEVKLTSGNRMSGISVIYGFHTGPEVPAEVIYRILKTLKEHVEELVNLYSGFAILKEEGFASFHARCIETLPHVPVHPGLAKLLKEEGMWKDEWRTAAQ